MIIITSKKEGFRRCGVAHPKKPTTYPDDRFSDTELEALKSEPMLVVEIREGEAEGAKKTAAKKPAATAKTKDSEAK